MKVILIRDKRGEEREQMRTKGEAGNDDKLMPLLVLEGFRHNLYIQRVTKNAYPALAAPEDIKPANPLSWK